MKIIFKTIIIVTSISLFSCNQSKKATESKDKEAKIERAIHAPTLQAANAEILIDKEIKMETATIGNGCFWCTEAVFESLKGVSRAESGYSGGELKNPTYKQICTGNTGHAEVIQIDFDANIIRFAEILEVFFATHDPTTLNQQGADRGTQYRSAIFYHNESQKEIAKKAIEAGNESKTWINPIVTEITKFDVFYPAGDYHQDYFNRVGEGNSYCTMVIRPKLDKFKKAFSDKLK